MSDIESLVATAHRLAEQQDYGQAAAIWTQLAALFSDNGRPDLTAMANYHLLGNEIKQERLTAAAILAGTLTMGESPLSDGMVNAVFFLMKCLAERGRPSEALALYRRIERADLSHRAEYLRIYGKCCLGSYDLGDTADGVAQAPAGFQASPIGRLITAILWLDRDSMTREYGPTLSCDSPEYYDSPIIETFYLKHHLTSRALPCGRRVAGGTRPRLAVSSIAFWGRFAHSVINYLAARFYADLYGFELETPEWQGHYFFALDDPAIAPGADLPLIRDTDLVDTLMSTPGLAELHVPPPQADLFSPYGSYLFSDHNKSKILSILTIRPHWQAQFEKPMAFLAERCRTLICFHIRLGDMEMERHASFGAIHSAAYQNWLEQNWHLFEAPLLYIASDEPERAKALFAGYASLSLSDLPDVMPIASHLLDFYILTQSDVLAISRGYFGKLAAALRDRPEHCYQVGDEDKAQLVAYRPWSSERYPTSAI